MASLSGGGGVEPLQEGEGQWNLSKRGRGSGTSLRGGVAVEPLQEGEGQ